MLKAPTIFLAVDSSNVGIGSVDEQDEQDEENQFKEKEKELTAGEMRHQKKKKKERKILVRWNATPEKKDIYTYKK